MLRVWRMSDTVGIAYSFCCTFKRLQLLCITWQSTHFPIFTLRDVKSDEPTQHAELSWSGIQQHQPDILNKHDVLSSRRDKITLKNQKAIAFFKFRGGFVKLLTSSTLMKKVPHCIGDRLSPLSVGHPWSGHLTLIYGTWAIFFSSKKNAGHFSSPEGDNTIIIGTRAFLGSASEVLCPFVGGNFRAWTCLFKIIVHPLGAPSWVIWAAMCKRSILWVAFCDKHAHHTWAIFSNRDAPIFILTNLWISNFWNKIILLYQLKKRNNYNMTR